MIRKSIIIKNSRKESLNDKLQRRRQERYKHGRSDNIKRGMNIPKKREQRTKTHSHDDDKPLFVLHKAVIR
jgi:hypothetical protein